MSDAYSKLSYPDAARVNAVILQQFRDNPNHFIEGLVKNSKALDPHSTEHGFDMLVTGMREALTRDLKNLPPVSGHYTDKLDVMLQREVLRAVRSEIGQGYEEAHYTNVVKREMADKSTPSNPSMVVSTKPYTHGGQELLAKAVATQTADLSGCQLAENKNAAACVVPNVKITQNERAH